jgi:GTPase
VAKERRKRVTTGQMNRFLERIDFQRAPVPMAKRIRIFYMTQAAVAPPTFVLFTDRDIKLHFAFERFLENQIREAFGFKGTPIWFKVKARAAPRQVEPDGESLSAFVRCGRARWPGFQERCRRWPGLRWGVPG